MIPVTKPFLPSIEEYKKQIEQIWERNWLTNNGPNVNSLELKLKEYLGVKHLLYLNNGTIAIQIAIKALGLKGDILTTPFSYVATTSSIIWENCRPIFVDIDELSLNINPESIESKITQNTSAILATHVFGNPCEIDKIDIIAKKYNLKVIYDAAHCFGTNYNGKSVFEFGDISTTSFHATKLFHTVEGGAVFTKDPILLKKMASLRNFGHSTEDFFDEIGINAKNSELHAAMGILNLSYIKEILERRKRQSVLYESYLRNTGLSFLKINSRSEFNFSYFPIIFKNEPLLLKTLKALEGNNIFPRRYFYPSLNTVKLFNGESCPVSESISTRILCLPLFFELTDVDIELISRIILRNLNY